MIRKLSLLAALSAAALLTSCETTGDPTQGGLFGWSSTKADGRIRAREDYLHQVESDTAYQRGRSQRLREEAAYKQGKLDGGGY